MLASTDLYPTTRPVATPEANPSRFASGLLLAQFAFFMVTLIVLGGAINWPASLDDPATRLLPLIKEQSGAVAIGYFCYAVSAMLLIPIAVLLRRVLVGQGTALLTVTATIGALAGVLKLLGIARWLVLMPSLADTYVDTGASQATRDTVVVVFNAFNRYAGGVGETLGVMLFSGLWTALVSIAILRGRRLPVWTGWFGLLAAGLLLVGVLSVFGVEFGPILMISGIAWQLWMIGLAVTLFRMRSQSATS